MKLVRSDAVSITTVASTAPAIIAPTEPPSSKTPKQTRPSTSAGTIRASVVSAMTSHETMPAPAIAVTAKRDRKHVAPGVDHLGGGTTVSAVTTTASCTAPRCGKACVDEHAHDATRSEGR